MIINDIEYKRIDDNYYISADGNVYSTYINRHLKHSIDIDGYHRVDIHSKHMKVHRLVYEAWVGNIPSHLQVNHIDDNKDNNSCLNLYVGDQRENIADCISNKHRCGNVKQITVFNKNTGKIEAYTSVQDFLKHTGHSITNGSLSHVINRKWFKEKYSIIEIKRCRDYRKLNS